MAARRFGFEQFFAPLYAEDRLRTGLLDGTGSGIAFLLSDVQPLADALATGGAFSMFAAFLPCLIRNGSPRRIPKDSGRCCNRRGKGPTH
jgi:DNA helicase-2/ATP-dependent DNA helicase PcrA